MMRDLRSNHKHKCLYRQWCREVLRVCASMTRNEIVKPLIGLHFARRTKMTPYDMYSHENI